MNGSPESPKSTKSVNDDQPILQFSSAIYFAEEDEGFVLLDCTKLGGVGKKCTVTYSTDPSPYENVKYRPTRGTLTFDDHDNIQTIAVELLVDDKSDSTLEFGVTLSEPVGAELGLYL